DMALVWPVAFCDGSHLRRDDSWERCRDSCCATDLSAFEEAGKVVPDPHRSRRHHHSDRSIAVRSCCAAFQAAGIAGFCDIMAVSPALACLAGGTAGLFVAYLPNCRTRLRESFFICGFILPIAGLVVCASTLALSAEIWRAH